MIITILVGSLTTYICSLISFNGFISLIVKGVICMVIPNIIYLIIFYRTKELQQILNIFINIFKKLSEYTKISYVNR